jgi:hypothetical protein
VVELGLELLEPLAKPDALDPEGVPVALYCFPEDEPEDELVEAVVAGVLLAVWKELQPR